MLHSGRACLYNSNIGGVSCNAVAMSVSCQALSGTPDACLMYVLDTDAAAVSIVLQNQLLQIKKCPLMLCVLTNLQISNLALVFDCFIAAFGQ